MSNSKPQSAGLKQQVEAALRRGGGAKIPEIAEDLNIPRQRVREVLREINETHELGSDPEFRYKILEGGQDE